MSFFGGHYVVPDGAKELIRQFATYDLPTERKDMEHTFTTNGIKIDTQISLTDPVAFGQMLAGQGFEQWLDFLWGLAREARRSACTIPDMLPSFRAAMDRQSDSVLEEILPLVIDLSQQIERELQQRHNAGRQQGLAASVGYTTQPSGGGRRA